MNGWVLAAWLSLAANHLPPALVIVRPSLLQTLYGAAADGTLAVLLTHRALLFLMLAIAAVVAAFLPAARPAAAFGLAFSMVGFLITYFALGKPESLTRIAIVDTLALPALALAGWSAMQR